MKVAFFLIALLLCVIASSAADLRGGQSLTFTKSSLKAESHVRDDDDDDEDDDEDDDDEVDMPHGFSDDGLNGFSPSPCDSKFVNQDGSKPVTVSDTGFIVRGRITVTNDFLSNSPDFWSSDEQSGVKYTVDCTHTLQAETGLCDEIKQTQDEQAGIKDCEACTGGTFTVTIGGNSRTVEMTCDGGVKKFCVKDGKNNCYPTSYENAPALLSRRRRLLQNGYSNC